ncbi:hypothetical protein H311_00605 [Anncaliia algerae PRA109]|nr:hypothetical protein H311_00605 [Anncaliia algerae PRA109]
MICKLRCFEHILSKEENMLEYAIQNVILRNKNEYYKCKSSSSKFNFYIFGAQNEFVINFILFFKKLIFKLKIPHYFLKIIYYWLIKFPLQVLYNNHTFDH